MPFKAIPHTDFVNRDRELEQLRRLADFAAGPAAYNVIVDGPRGIGKTELLKQLYGRLFRENKGAIPFYYPFQRATLQPGSFSKDYVHRFVRQVLAFVRREPGLVDNAGLPVSRLIPSASEAGLEWLLEMVDNFSALRADAEAYELVAAAVSAPQSAAARGGHPVVVMLDDFQLAARMSADGRDQGPGLVSLFAALLDNPATPCILSGSPQGALDELFGVEGLRGKADRITLGPLAENEAFQFFSALCTTLGAEVLEEVQPLMQFLGGNALYIRNMARALWRTGKTKVAARDFWEGYSQEVSEGQTAFYWSAVLGDLLRQLTTRRTLLAVLTHVIRADAPPQSLDLLARNHGWPLEELRPLVKTLDRMGILHAVGGLQPIADPVLQDFILAGYWREIEGRPAGAVQELIEARHAGEAQTSTFEMTIPMETDAELVAAKAIEQICTNVSLPPEIISPLQLALIEACINAKEHSGSYEKKMVLRFGILPERVEIAVESPGKAFLPDAGGEPNIDEKLNADYKRGWGLKLMRELMDEVRVETVGGRTRVVLVKNIPQE